jgi:hypothetical protein
LSYLAKVASDSDNLPGDKVPVEDLDHGRIEDILIAAAMAESVKEELLSVVDEKVDTTAPEEIPAEQVAPEVQEVLPETVPVNNAIVQEEDNAPHEQSQSLTEQTPPQLPVDIDIANESGSNIPPAPVETECPAVTDEEQHPMFQETDIPDWESLISYSEADDITTRLDDMEPTHDMQIPLGVSIRDVMEDMTNQDIDVNEDFSVFVPQINTIKPAAIDPLDIGNHFVKDTNFFEDVAQADNIPSKSPRKRKSLDSHSVIFSFTGDRDFATSAPERPLDEENVLPHLNILIIVRDQETENRT